MVNEVVVADNDNDSNVFSMISFSMFTIEGDTDIMWVDPTVIAAWFL